MLFLVDRRIKRTFFSKTGLSGVAFQLDPDNGKDLHTCTAIWDFLEKNHAGRNSALVIAGGGTTGDIGGFCASVFKRGIPFILIPTTLLAAADSCLGGKTGVDFHGHRNHLGTYSFPEDIFILPSLLDSLSKDEIRSGFAEITKHALIADARLWKTLKKDPFDEHFASKKSLEGLIRRSLHVKWNVVVTDPFEEGPRRLLNFGHTFAHAFESLAKRKNHRLTHGDAVALGMLCESMISYLHRKLVQKDLEEITEFLTGNFVFPAYEKKDFGFLLEEMKEDKKNAGIRVNCTLLNGIGKGSVDHYPEEKVLRAALEYGFAFLK